MTKLQRHTLQILLRFRDRPPTVPRLLWTNRWLYVLTAVIFAGMAWFLYAMVGEIAASYVGVAFAAIVLRDIGFFRRTVAFWPVNRAIIDWEKAGELASTDARQRTPLP